MNHASVISYEDAIAYAPSELLYLLHLQSSWTFIRYSLQKLPEARFQKQNILNLQKRLYLPESCIKEKNYAAKSLSMQIFYSIIDSVTE